MRALNPSSENQPSGQLDLAGLSSVFIPPLPEGMVESTQSYLELLRQLATFPQVCEVIIDLEPASCEHITDTVSYAAVAAKAKALAQTGHFKLVETFAELLARDCLDDAKVIRARVRIEKPEALAPDAAAGGVEIVVGRRARAG